MGFRIQASGVLGANSITIEPVQSEDSGGAYVRIRVMPKNGEHPGLPILPRGAIYKARNGTQYTILNVVVTEEGPEDGDFSFWFYDYLALVGAHTLTGLQY